MKNIIITLIPVVIITFIIPYHEPFLCYLWLLPVVIIVLLKIFEMQKLNNNKKEVPVNKDVLLKDIFRGKAINFILIVCYLLVLGISFNIFPKTTSFNSFVVLLYFLLNSNVNNMSLGFRIYKIEIQNNMFSSKLKIILNNFITLSPFYIILLNHNFSIPDHIINILFGNLFLLNLVNIFSRYYIFKKESFLEKILGLEYVSQKQNIETETEEN